MKVSIVIMSFTFTYLFSSAQSPKHRVLSIPVEKNNVQLFEPWEGGFNSPQFSPIHLNNDSFPDLFVFDRVGNKVLTFINLGNSSDTTYVYAPQYEELFPKDLFSWVLIRDYNNDNIPDIFTYVNSGIRVFKGSYVNGLLHFDIVSNLLLYDGGNQDVNIWASSEDIPVIADVNLDGDIDVLSYGVFGTLIEYFENQTVENPGNIHYEADSFKFIPLTSFGCGWGRFAEGINTIIMNITCKTDGQDMNEEMFSRDSRDGNHAIYAFDKDGDRDVDLLLGSSAYTNMFMLENCGDSSDAWVCSYDSLFPFCDVPINFHFGPAAFELDADNDGLKDLIIASNVRNGSQDIKNVLLYKNTGDTSCLYSFVSDSFLTQHILDFGTDAKPVFVDLNGDGLQDIVVGNYGYFRPFTTYKSTLAYLENIGTATSPRFALHDTDYANISSFNLVGVHPAFGDLDGDGKQDLIIGDTNGYLQYFKNAGTTVASFPSMTTPQFFNIDVGQFSAPFIYDVNGDSLNDLVVGRRDGKLSYFWNYGTSISPLFHRDSVNDDFGGISIREYGYIYGNSQPFIMKDSSGTLKLFVGSLRGAVYEYDIDFTKLRGGAFTLIDSNFLKRDVGAGACIAIADLNNDGFLEYAVGTSRGGIELYSDSVWDPHTTLGIASITRNENELIIYPNPAKDYFVCEAKNIEFRNPKTEIFNLLGEKINTEIKSNTSSVTVNTSQLPNGFYIVKISDSGKFFTGKILVTK